MKINKNVENFLLYSLATATFLFLLIFVFPFVFIYSMLAISFVIDKGNEIGFPWATVFVTLLVIAGFINTIQNELKQKNLKPTRKNIISVTKSTTFAWVAGILIIALGVYLISLWPPLLFFIFATAFFGSFIPLGKSILQEKIINRRKKK